MSNDNSDNSNDDKYGTETSVEREISGLGTEGASDPTLELNALGTADLVRAMERRDAAVCEAVRSATPRIAEAIDAIVPRLKRGGRLVYVGAGTSGRLGVLDASEIPPTFGMDPSIVVGLIAGGRDALVRSAESAEDHPETGARDLRGIDLTADDCVVGIAASGRTPYVIGALDEARSTGALTIALACNACAAISAHADIAIEVPVGPEFVSGSTRLGAGTATKMTLNMLSTITMIRLGKTYRTLMVDVKATNEKLVARAIRIVRAVTDADETQARRALEQAGWSAKTAIVMIERHCDAAAAQAVLDDNDGFLAKVIDS
ncbi:N-acetylmuramic acid 6-phosphate etherase [Bifidobacterium sp. 82T10]|uniref:N-acetylmuramic acid 6-phosphate etherase n=1 Tax=Bifidobacterium miconis TaxID=2834435 RepID=A0ABS6WDC9_9BIFI|nr:N-acetylmuramic acid 6-phosphate etherase [Bifidobacterium miconis]MBW3092045.1 N-acetylmuramic acid 6-phosphate etherase [Bifidobacterium miconis]